jgi:sugar/nucleoside kinase (ribokinase family)
LASDRQVLAWESADQDVYGRRVEHGRDVVEDLNVRPMRRENTSLPRVQLALPTDREACLLEAKIGTADTREGASYGERCHAATFRFRDS